PRAERREQLGQHGVDGERGGHARIVAAAPRGPHLLRSGARLRSRTMSETRFATTPQPPYWAVIFSTRRTAGDHGYSETADRMEALAREQPGYLGIESTRDAEGFGITVSYWRDENAIERWRTHAEHAIAQARGRGEWYAGFELRVARVERAWGMR